jgi:acyl-CoA thioesterase-1
MVIDHHPTHVIIMGGTNDVSLNIPDEQIIANIYAMTRQAKHHGIQSIIGIPTPFFFEGTPMGKSFFLQAREVSKRIELFSDKLRGFVKEDAHPFIDFSENMTPELFLEDGVHPSERGHAVMAESARAALEKILTI